jgi:hypothetical protein
MTATSHPLSRIRLELARSHEFPSGSAKHGYEFVAPLDNEGHLDAAAWKAARDRCRVFRFWGHNDEDLGHLIHRPGGSWAFHYDIEGDEDDEAGYRLGSHTFNIGDYVSIKDDDGVMHTFRVVRNERI